MALEAAGTFALKFVVTELLKSVVKSKEKASNHQQALTRLGCTLASVIPRVDHIIQLNQKLNIPDEKMEELITILQNGKALVDKCCKTSAINLVRKNQHSKQLLELDNSLLRYFQTTLLLDHASDTKEILLIVRKLDNSGNVGEKDEGESSMSLEDTYYENMTYLVEENAKLIPEIENIKGSRGEDTWKFRLKGCVYNFDMEDITYYSTDGSWKGMEEKRYDVTDCECTTGKNAKVMVMRYEEVVMQFLQNNYIPGGKTVYEDEFEDQIESLRNVGSHPNIVPPIGYCFHDDGTLLFYDNIPRISLYSQLHEYRGRRLGFCDASSAYTPDLVWDTKLKISLGVARGISHLHSVGFVHGNLNSSNVLLTSNFDGCISAYGLQYFSSANQQSDVHSFGILLVEILSRTVSILLRSKWRDYCESPKYNAMECKMLHLAMQCLEDEPDKRPKMEVVLLELENMFKYKHIYM